jgi:hypothetical protein
MGKGKRLRGLRANTILMDEQPDENQKVEPTVQQMKDLGMQEFEIAEPKLQPNRAQRRYWFKRRNKEK